MTTLHDSGPLWFRKVVDDAEESLREYFQGGRIGPGTQELLIQVLGQLHSIGKPHEELVQEFEKEVQEFKDIGFQYE